MTVKEALSQQKCGGCWGGPDPEVCPCTPAERELVTKFESKYPFGSIDIGAELGLWTDLTVNVRYQQYLADLEMEVEDWLKEN